ncbi:MAG: CehA/McbA family metallohydrolase [Pseudomonadota bacterium]
MEVDPLAAPLSFRDAPDADDVDVMAFADRLWLAWSRATLESESVFLASLDGTTWSDPPFKLIEEDGAIAFRPSLAPFGDGVLLLGCAGVHPAAPLQPVGVFVKPDAAPARFILGGGGDADTFGVQVASSPMAERAFVVWEEQRGMTSRVRAGRLDRRGRFEEVALPLSHGAWCRSPAITTCDDGAWLAWVETKPGARGGAIAIARVEDRGAIGKSASADQANGEAPALALTPDGRPLAAWHTDAYPNGSNGITRWLRVVLLGRDGVWRDIPLPPPSAHDRRETAGTDQGWEFPSVAVTQEGTIWIAGRSSNGFHVAKGCEENGFGPRLALSDTSWGGRGRRASVRCTDRHGVLVARSEPKGIVVTCVEPGAMATILSPPVPAASVCVGSDVDVARGPTTTTSPTTHCRARPQRNARCVLFGDIHQHSAHSDGLGSAEDLLSRARDTRGLDFAAVTDHDRFCRRAIGPATWRYLCHVADAFDESGRFVAFAAYEQTGARHPGGGHRCVYFGDHRPGCLPSRGTKELFATLRELGGIAVPHHVGWTGADMSHHDPLLQPVWEICSVHGTYEGIGKPTAWPARDDPLIAGQLVKDALDAGLRFGFIGGTDSHGLVWHHGISPRPDPFATGLAAVLEANLSRASIMQALRERRVYATTGARILLRVELDGALMGSELPASTRGFLFIEVKGTAPLAMVSLIRAGGEEPIEGTNGCQLASRVAVALEADRRWDYFFVRVIQIDGEMAWSSPIWIG